MTRRLALALMVVAVVLLVPAAAVSAHPLGNFTINHYAGIRVTPQQVDVGLVVDMAEVPTFQVRPDIRAQGERAWETAECRRRAAESHLSVQRRAIPLRLASSAVRFAPGQGGLPTLRLECDLTAPVHVSAGAVALAFEDRADEGRLGWREVTAVGDRTTLVSSDVPSLSITHRLTSYPKDLLQSPLDIRIATLRVRPGGPALERRISNDPGVRTTGLPLGADRLTSRYTALIERQHLTLLFLLGAAGLALLLGAIHALAPGHGKTVMAAYLVGERGSLRQGLLMGLTVTVTHTAGVLALGAALSASKIIAPERLYPWLTVASGVLFAAIGVSLLRRLARARRQAHAHHHHDHPHEHDHDHDHHHHHDPHEHAHGGVVHSHPVPDPGMSLHWRSLVTLGLAGGMVPTPSALVVLLGAIALGRLWLGLVLVVLYGVGMAMTLIGAGLFLVRARHRFDRRARRRPGRLAALGQLVPAGTATLIVLVGVALAARGLAKV